MKIHCLGGCREVGRNARAHVEKEYGWGMIAEKVREVDLSILRNEI